MPLSVHPSSRLRAGRAFLLAATMLGAGLQAAPTLPTGASVAAGTGSVSVAGSTLTVNQTSAKLAVNWDSFSIGEGASVRFVQPSASSVALNRVTGADASVIQGSLTANGQVFLLNPSGVLFARTAQVSVGGLVASTLSLSNEDFLAGHYAFSAPGAGLVVNEGNLVAVGGSVTLIAAQVINSGTISAERGAVNLAAGSRVTLNLGGLVNVAVEEGVVDALVRNGGAIRADGGRVLLTARGAGELTAAAISNEGLIEAHTLATGEKGEVRLLGGMTGGDTVAVSGRIDVSAPAGGDGGFIETSAARVDIAEGAQFTAGSALGRSGTWLLDPDNIEIVAAGGVSVATAAATPTGTSQISVTTLSNALLSADVSLQAGTSIDFKVPFTYAGNRAATLSLYAPTVYLGGGLTASTAALNLNFGGVYLSTNYAGTVCLTAGDVALTTLGGNVVFNGDLGGNAALAVNTGGGNITVNSAVTGTTTISHVVTGNMVVEYQAGGGSVNTYSYVDFAIPEIVIDAAGTPRPPAQFRGTQVFPKGTVTILSGTLVSLNANGIVDFTRPNGTVFSLTANSGGSVTFTATEQVDFIEFFVKSANWVTMSANSVSWLQTGALGKLTNLTLNAGSGSVNVNASIAVNGDIIANASRFVNTAGSSALQPGASGKWQVWSSNPAPFNPSTGDVTGSLPYDFKQYGATYGATPLGTGNGLFYSYQPTIVASLLNSVTKVYDGNTAATNLTNANYAISSGAVGGDVVSFTGALPTGGTYASKNVGTGISIISDIIPLSNLSTVSSTGKPVYGYGPSSLTATGNIGIITKKTLTSLTGITALDRNYDQGTVATLNTAGAIFGGKIAGDTLTISATGAFADKNAANGKTVTISGLTLGGADAGNYDLPAGPFTTTASIFKLNISAVTGITASDKVYDGNTSATLDTTSAGFTGLLSGDTLTVSSAAGAFVDKNVGQGKTVNITGLVLGGLDAVNYNLVSANATTTAAITKKSLTSLTGITAQSRYYNRQTGATLDTSAASFGGKVVGDTLTIAAATGTFSDKDSANGKTVTISGLTLGGADAGNYDLPAGPFTTTASIWKLDIIAVTGITAADKVYDGNTSATLNTGSAGFTGLLAGDTLAVGSATGAFVDKNAGQGKTVNISGLTISGADAINYNLTTSTGTTTAAITKLQLTSLTGITASDKSYDRGTGATLDTTAASLGGLLPGDTLTIASATGTFADKNAANGKTVGISNIVFGGADADNYDLPAGPFTTTASILKLDITAITGITAADKVYDGNTSATLDTSTAGFTGLLAGDTLTVGSATGAFVDKNAGQGKTVNITGLTISGADAINYNLITVNSTTTAAITKLQLTSLTGITASDKSYDRGTGATLDTTTASLGGLLPGDTLTIASATGTFTDKNAANGKTVGITNIVFGGADADNYDLPAGPFTTTASILKLDITAVTGITAFDKVYDGNTSATLDTSTAGFTGLLAGDTLTVSSAIGDFVDKNAGQGKTVNITGLVLGGLDAVNYNLLSANSTTTAAITKKQLTSITGLTAQNKVYDGLTGATLNTASPTFGGMVPGDTLTIASATGSFADANAANGKTVTISGLTLGGLDADNYDLPASVTALGNITKAPLHLTANSHSVAYSGNAYAGGNGVTITGFVLTEGTGDLGGSLGFSGSSQGAVNGGTYVLTPYGYTSGNYDLIYTNGTLTINGAPVVVDPHEFLPKTVVVPVYPIATPAVQMPMAVGGLNYVPVTPAGVPIAASANGVANVGAGSVNASSANVGTGSANGAAANAGAPSVKVANAPEPEANGEIKNGQATDRIDRGVSRSIQGPTDILVVEGGVNLGQKPLSAE